MARKKKEDNLEELEDSSEKKKKSFLSFGSEKESTKEQRLVFFGFYAVFFIIVAFMILGGRTTLNNQNNNGVSPEEEEEYTGLVAPNYNYEYKIEIDDNTYIYSGKRLYSKDLFTYGENDKKSSYYKEKDTYYKLVDKKWIEDENPYIYEEFLDIDSIDYLFANADDVGVQNNKNMRIYSYEITSSMLSDTLDATFLADGENKNTFVVYLNTKTKRIEKIELDLSDYGIQKQIATKKFKFTLQYSNFNKIKEIKSPVE